MILCKKGYSFLRRQIWTLKARNMYNKNRKIYILKSKYMENNFFIYKKTNEMPIFFDRFAQAGKLDEHYFLQDIYMAKKVIQKLPEKHYDIGSRVDGFISHLLTNNLNVTMIDIRPLDVQIENLSFLQGDATNLETVENQSITSLSSLHAIEHFGLGRYGDDINPEAWKTALHSFERILQTDGILYLSVPIGREDMLFFDAHRVFHPLTIINELNMMKLVSFSYIKDMKVIDVFDIINLQLNEMYLCGLFVFQKV